MPDTENRTRDFFGLSSVLVCSLLALCTSAFALNPSLDVSQYAHTVWRIRDGFSKGTVQAIAQTPDGYLWLGTEMGLLRFDGIRTVPWQPPSGPSLPSDFISKLLVTRDGTLWIGSGKGLVSWKSGKLTPYPELAGQYVMSLLEDREGTIWVGETGAPNGKLCALQNSTTHCVGEDGSLGPGVLGLYQDSKGNLWVGVKDGLWQWRPGTPTFYSLPDNPDGIQAFAEGEDGSLLIGTRTGISRFVDGKFESFPLPRNTVQFRPRLMLRDRDGGLWIVTLGQGILHLHRGRTDVYTETDGLSSNDLSSIFQDREGNIWVSTQNGFGRFRDFAVPTLTTKQGLSSAVAMSVLPDKDGSIWFGTRGGLHRWVDGQVSVFGKDGTLNGDSPSSLFQDSRGRIWVSTIHGFGYLKDDKFVPIRGLPADYVHGIAEDNAGNLWIAEQNSGLFRLSPSGDILQVSWPGLGHKDPAAALIADPLHGGLWLGFFNGGIAYFSDGGIRASYSSGNGLGEGWVGYLTLDPDGTLWASTQGGLSRLKDGRVATLTSKNGLPCDAVHWAIEDDDHYFWLYMPCGLVRIARSELEAWATIVEKDKTAKPTVRFAVFDSPDGVRLLGHPRGYVPQVTKSADGRLWFLPSDGVSVIDPRHLALNKLPPPVHAEEIIADSKVYSISLDANGEANGKLWLPPRVRDLQIDYTALSLVAPEKVLFRYKLEGWDRDWQDVGTRRQAYYSNLPPRKYTFRVKACNNSGVWNEAGTSLDFAIAPAYWQTWWFRSLCVIGFLGLLYALYELRLRQMAQQFNTRMETRVAERTRIARDLHDTMLQTLQGLSLKLYAVTCTLPDSSEFRKTLENLIDQARQAVTESRDVVHGLRSSTLPANEIAEALSTLGDELATAHAGDNRPEFCVQVEGKPRDLAPLLKDEVYRIGGEALRNAFQHAAASRIEVEIHYDQRRFRLRVQDNGKGMEPEILAKGREGHYGLASLQERAKTAGGKIEVWSKVDSGTEVELTIPASIAFAKVPARESASAKKPA